MLFVSTLFHWRVQVDVLSSHLVLVSRTRYMYIYYIYVQHAIIVCEVLYDYLWQPCCAVVLM